jgi:hypothetical protein
MGAWGTDIFDNDAAADWSYGVADGGLRYVHSTLRDAVDAVGYLDADDGAAALAAAETVARLRGNAWVESAYSAAVDEWVKRQSGEVPTDLAALAALAVRRVIGDDSELADLWDEAGEAGYTAWRRVLDDLIGRLDV